MNFKEYAVTRTKSERAVMDRVVPMEEMSERQQWQTRYLIYAKCLFEINTDPQNAHIRLQLNNETKPDKRAEIIQRYIINRYPRQWSSIGRQIGIKDITYFDSNNDYLTQFDIK